MEPAPLPPPKAKVFRRFGPSIIAGVVVIFFAFAVLWSFRPSNSSDDADVVKLDKTATTLIPGAPDNEKKRKAGFDVGCKAVQGIPRLSSLVNTAEKV